MFSGSLVAIVTPMRGDGSIDHAAWARLIDWHIESGTSGLVVGGTTGESATLTDEELWALAQQACAQARHRVPVVVGVGSSSTAASVERARRFSELGVEGFLGTLRPHKPTKSPERQKQRVASEYSRKLPTLSEEIERLKARPHEQQLHALVHNVLTSAGLTSVQDNSSSQDTGVDFVVWSDSLRGSFGNPVLVEVKGYLERAQFQFAYERLTKLVSESNSAAGVLLYLKKPGQAFERPRGWNPLVLWFDVGEFTVELLHRNFAEILIERRNLMVHGMQF